MRPGLTKAVFAAAVAFAPAPQTGQQGSCDLEVLSTVGSTGRSTQLPEGGFRYDIGGGVEATCGDKWMRADSASSFQNRTSPNK